MTTDTVQSTTDPLQSAVRATLRNFGRIGASYPVYFRRPTCWEVAAAEELLKVDNLRSYFTRAIAAAALIPLSGGVALDVAIP